MGNESALEVGSGGHKSLVLFGDVFLLLFFAWVGWSMYTLEAMLRDWVFFAAALIVVAVAAAMSTITAFVPGSRLARRARAVPQWRRMETTALVLSTIGTLNLLAGSAITGITCVLIALYAMVQARGLRREAASSDGNGSK